MSYTSSIAIAQTRERFALNWIVNQRSDLLWFIGGALAGYLMFFLHAGLHLDMITVWFLWVVFIDTPHFFGTYSRTYLDKEEWHHRKKLYIGSLGWFLAGPLMIVLSYFLYQAGTTEYKIPYLALIVFFNLWAYWHVVRQHYGIMSLYKRKNGDFDLVDRRLDQAVLYGGLIAPFIAFIIRHPEARRTLGLSEHSPPFPHVEASNFLSYFYKMFSADFITALSWEQVIVILSVFVLVGVIIAFAARQVQRWRRGLPLNLPKIFFLIALIPLYVFICFSPAVFTAPLLAFSAFVTVYHDIQYFAIVWFYNRNRYHKKTVNAKKTYGLAAVVSKNFLTFMISGIVMAGVFRLLGCSLEIHPGCGTLVMTSKQVMFGDLTTRELLRGFMLGFPLHHYFLDQYIWRPSKDKTLREDLKLQNQ